MKKTKFLILLFLINYCFGQNPINKLSITKTDNLSWVENLEKISSKSERIKLIVEKIKKDSIIDFKNADRIVINVKNGETIQDAIDKHTDCKILFVLYQKEVGHLLDLNQYPNYTTILQYLTPETINSTAILKGEKVTSLYGSRASCGVIILKSEDKKLRKLIRKHLKKPNV